MKSLLNSKILFWIWRDSLDLHHCKKLNCLRLFFTCIFQQVGGTFQSWPLDMTPKEFCENYDRVGNIIFKFSFWIGIKNSVKSSFFTIADSHFHYPSKFPNWAFKRFKITQPQNFFFEIWATAKHSNMPKSVIWNSAHDIEP